MERFLILISFSNFRPSPVSSNKTNKTINGYDLSMKSLQQELRVTKDNLGNIHILRHHFWGRGGFIKIQFLVSFITKYIYA